MIIAVTALVTSISYIGIALHHSYVMEMLVQANSLPYMQGGFSDVTPEGEKVLSLDLLNRGVGPAHEKSLYVKVGGDYVRICSRRTSGGGTSSTAIARSFKSAGSSTANDRSLSMYTSADGTSHVNSCHEMKTGV